MKINSEKIYTLELRVHEALALSTAARYYGMHGNGTSHAEIATELAEELDAELQS